MLRVVVAAPPAVRSPADLSSLPRAADLFELRLDLLPGAATEDGAARWVAASPRPVLATVRSRAQGGAFDGTPERAARILAAAAGAGAAWVDLEAEVAPHLPDLPSGVELLASFHGEGEARFAEVATGRRVVRRKLARPVADPTALARALREAQDPAATGGDLTVVPYGALAGMRAAFVGAPGHLLFGAASAGSAVVPGQPALLELLDELRAGEVGPGADLFGLLGDPPERSPSPALHNAAFRATGRAALYVPLPGVDPGAALCLPFAGFSVTTPYKSVALARADAADAVAREIGAANTLVRGGDGRWHASNTDALAVAESVPPAGEGGAGAFVYGAGGFAAAAASALRLRGYAVRVGARRPEAARAFAVPRGFPVAGRVYAREPGDRVLVNATPAGADGAEPEFLRGARLDGLRVLDAPYRRAGRTGVAARAEDAGAERVVDGFDLLLRQARGQVRAFGGGDLDPGVLALALRPPLPLLLMGLRGAGKTVVGRAVARRLGRPFVDLDEEVTRLTGRSPGWWIRTQGEARFREVEADGVERLEGRRGIVVAAGGGVLEHPRARAAVERSTRPVWLEVPPEVAAARVAADPADRPGLLPGADPGEEARRILARRAPAWRAVARRTVDASREIDAVAAEVATWWTHVGPNAEGGGA